MTDTDRPNRTRTLILVVGVAGLIAGAIGIEAARRAVGVVFAGDAPAAPTTQPAEDDAKYYTCGMHPWIVLPEPGLCPVCHMDLTPIDPEKFTGEIAIDPMVVQNIGVRTAPVTRGPLVQTIRTVGTVDYDETAVRDINIKVTGWIEDIFVDFLGAKVEAGAPLFELYSPALYAAQEEYLLAYRANGRDGRTLDLLQAARTRLDFYDITAEQITRLEQRDVAAKTMTIHSPHRGVVISKHANEGMRVDEGMLVYRIADLSKVWVMVALYEHQLPYVEVGQTAIMTLSYIAGQEFRGEVLYIYPYLDTATRQVNVRLAFDNPNGLLKPGMYANVELQSTLAGERTLAPRSAIIDTGTRQVAFVSLGEGRFEPRNVQMGVETTSGVVEILAGLSPGELVVTSGQFLLDSEAKIRESLARMISGDMAADQEAVVATAGTSTLSSLPPEAEAALNDVLTEYFAIGDTLADDSIEGISDQGRELASAVDRLLAVEVPDHPHFWHEHDEVATVRGKALELIDEPDMKAARQTFADLSAALGSVVKATGVPPSLDREVQQIHCPMYRADQGGAIWLQFKGDVRNPFYGSMMLECFDERVVLPVTGRP